MAKLTNTFQRLHDLQELKQVMPRMSSSFLNKSKSMKFHLPSDEEYREIAEYLKEIRKRL